MAAHFFDIDGTLVNYHDNTWIEGARELLCQLHDNGNDIILITMRGPQDEGTLWSIDNTKKTILRDLDGLGIKYKVLLEFSHLE
jgi:predicted mannosyl-3-phosphoglycerate phosphatase (HAD superfamily)